MAETNNDITGNVIWKITMVRFGNMKKEIWI